MWLIWRGAGILVPIFFGGFTFLGLKFAGQVEGLLDSSADTGYVGLFLGWGAASALTWWVGSRLNAPETVVDEQSGESHELRNIHTLFFVPMHYWAIPGGLVLLFMVYLRLR